MQFFAGSAFGLAIHRLPIRLPYIHSLPAVLPCMTIAAGAHSMLSCQRVGAPRLSACHAHIPATTQHWESAPFSPCQRCLWQRTQLLYDLFPRMAGLAPAALFEVAVDLP